MADKTQTINRIREFNRFYMPSLSLLGNHYLGSEYSATEARVLFEIYENDGCRAADIAKAMNIDKSYLSRIIKNHEKNGYITRKVSESDMRAFALHLTDKGTDRTRELIEKSNDEIGNIVATLSEKDCTQLVDALNTVTAILKKSARMKIVPYNEKYKEDFIAMNLKWISEMFVVEEEDIRVLNNIEARLKKGGQIFFAIDGEDNVLACCMISPLDNGEWEIEKFCARGLYTGTGAGSACLEACISYAKKKKAPKIVIVSHPKCTHAVNLYRKFGFTEVPVDKEKFPFDRAGIAFEQDFCYD